MNGIDVTVCSSCGWRGFPARLWCPSCGSERLGTEQVAAGMLEEATLIRKAPGRELPAPVAVATVALAGGGHAIARLEGGTGEVALSADGGAPVAREAS